MNDSFFATILIAKGRPLDGNLISASFVWQWYLRRHRLYTEPGSCKIFTWLLMQESWDRHFMCSHESSGWIVGSQQIAHTGRTVNSFNYFSGNATSPFVSGASNTSEMRKDNQITSRLNIPLFGSSIFWSWVEEMPPAYNKALNVALMTSCCC